MSKVASRDRTVLMTADDFRRLALSLAGVAESAHMSHPDFRAAGKIFATLGYPEAGWGMVKLTPEQQHDFLQRSPGTFKPSAGAWGRQGSTLVLLDTVDETTLHEALTLAWRHVIHKAAAKRSKKRSQ